eukprot:490517-Ditylum_brightwellii.AAC.1
MDIAEMLQGECRLGDLHLDKSRDCQDFHVLGNCRNTKCWYLHNTDIRPSEAKTQKLVGFSKLGIKENAMTPSECDKEGIGEEDALHLLSPRQKKCKHNWKFTTAVSPSVPNPQEPPLAESRGHNGVKQQ